MFEIGASLAAARRARGLGMRDAERLTCMRSKYLTALEEGRFDELPGRTYARAFLRTYPLVYISDTAVRPSVALHELSYTTWITNASSSSPRPKPW